MAKTLSLKMKQVFSYDDAQAQTVKLAGDFTGWLEHAILLKKQKGGQWTAGVELAAGTYQYRFIVDGQWQDDTKCGTRVPNPFGTFNAVCTVPGKLK